MTAERAGRARRRALVAVLAVLPAVNLLAFLLVERVDEGLQAEEREHLSFMAQTLGLEIARRLPTDLTDGQSLLELGERFDRARTMADLEAVLLVNRSGMIVVESSADGIRVRGRFIDDAERATAEEVWDGAEVFARAVGERRRDGGYLFHPVFAGGEVGYALGLVAGDAFRERLERLSPMILLSRSFGALLLLLFGLLLVLTTRRLARVAERRERVAERRDRPPGSDTDFVIQTFHEVVTNLRESESELKSLYTRAEERASYIEKTVAYMLRTLPTGVLIFDRDRKVLLINGAARDILRLPRRDYRGEGAEAVFGGRAELIRLLDELLTGARKHSRYELRLAPEGGDEAWVGLSTSVVRDPTGGVIGGAFLMADLTETKRLRARVALKDRLSAMGEISAGLAHELRNSLATLLGYCRLVDRELDEHAACRPHVARIVDEVRLLEATTERLLEFVRPGRRSPVATDPEALLAAAVRAVRERSGDAPVEVATRFGAAGALVDADAAALRKAFENLIENSFQAMAGGGALTVATRPAARAGERDASSDAADLLEIEIADTGCGIAPEDLDRVFVPFFTTKERGTGLGLAIVQKTIADHDGTIDVESRVGGGTTFRILLPCRAAAAAGSGLAPRAEGAP
jgi:PAS domain S-box-containing protein